MKAHYSSLTKKGQVTIPSSMRKMMRLNNGDKVEFAYHENYIAIIPINNNVQNLKGILPKPSSTLSCEEMNKIIKGNKT